MNNKIYIANKDIFFNGFQGTHTPRSVESEIKELTVVKATPTGYRTEYGLYTDKHYRFFESYEAAERFVVRTIASHIESENLRLDVLRNLVATHLEEDE